MLHHLLYVPLSEPSSAAAGRLQQKESLHVTTLSLTQAIKSDLAASYHLILLDGLVASAELQNACIKLRGSFTNPLLVLLTEADEASLVALYTLGVDECIVKPIDPELLAAKVRSWLRWTAASEPMIQQSARESASQERPHLGHSTGAGVARPRYELDPGT